MIYICFQVFLMCISLMVLFRTLYSKEILRLVSPFSNRLRISNICSSVNFEDPFLDPMLGLRNLDRPLEIMSLVFNNIVPHSRCSGFTQAGLSHLCKTIIPSGMGPWYNSYETLCANFFGKVPLGRIMPYPWLFLLPFHTQQKSVFMNLDKNLFSKVSRFPAMLSLWVSSLSLSTSFIGVL